eukprot:CAMPEP_0168530242 /NCGR_PEP_ID=MMETSP0405-20121227/14528_1 /TAXON_ID=498012 /ORGANISM="Trichosphaerium sp, Strain Am-I-7 wt" /LENGTH=432 /DNA_ID=CAMNT_0008554401 /DNA_START=122 /DNA_END=1417 /DNA_ORIENTATION=-
MDDVGKLLGVKTIDQWATITRDQLYWHGGKSIATKHSNSMITLLNHVYPNYPWAEMRFNIEVPLPQHMMIDHKRWLNKMAEKLALKTFEDWYSVDGDQVKWGKSILQKYNRSLYKALKANFPQFPWIPWKFQCHPGIIRNQSYGHWKDIKNHKYKFDQISIELGLKTVEDWDSISHQDLQKAGAKTLMKHYGSIPRALKSLYPQYEWLPKRVPNRYWHIKENIQQFLEYAEEKLSITDPSMWYRVSHGQITGLGAGGIVKYYPQILNLIHPTVKWDWSEFYKAKSKKSQQWGLSSALKKIYPLDELQEEHIIGVRESTGAILSVDICIPNRNLAFEYQGEQHYHDIYPLRLSAMHCEWLDQEKSKLCAAAGISLVPIPYWWEIDDIESLKATINFYKPDANLSVSPDVHHLNIMPSNTWEDQRGVIMTPTNQ